ncbi:MAG: iron complex outerrane recepter protein [Gammaproteobacteria bacterium]|jgi:iron complex outermembrane receptor protein|nr:iron complex outerrane recepter protein [Gammaproteobacteria bacterium]
MRYFARQLAGPLFLSFAVASSWVGAQQATEPAGSAPARRSEPSAELAEVVVTAEKRTERIQDTPISVTALSGIELAQQGVMNTAEAARQVPGVALTSSGPGQTEYTIRGLSSSGPAVSTVGFYLDDVPVAAPAAAQNGHVSIDPDLYDLNRIEVLRGPQGTLYGSGSMGGTVKLVTNQPDLHAFDASAAVDGSFTSGGGANGRISAMANIPLIDGRLALRLVGTEEHVSGWIDRIVLNNFPLPTNPAPACGSFGGCTRGNVLSVPTAFDHKNVNDENLHALRGTIKFQATDELNITATGFYQRLALGGLSNFDNPPGTRLAHYQPFDVAEPFADTFSLGNLVAEYNFPWFSVTSATSYWKRRQSQTQDVSESAQTLFDLPSYDTADGGLGPVSVLEVDDTRQISEEIRLTSSGDTRFKWLIGGFYSDYKYHQLQSYAGDGIAGVFGTPNLIELLADDHLKQKAIFGEGSYKLTTQLKATLGLRRYSYTQDGGITLSGALAPTLFPTTTPINASNSGVNPKFTLSYNVIQDLMIYGTAAKGFRPGNGNTPVPVTGPDSCLNNLNAIGKTSAPTQYDPDTVWSYEIGEKATMLDRRLTISSDIYYERWSGVQQAIILPCGFGYTDNVGTANVKGGELEINAKLTPAWTLEQSVGITQAVFTATELGTGVNVGDRLLHVPSYTASTSLIYSVPVSDTYNLVARASNVIVGPSRALTYFPQELPGYDIVNARAGLVSSRWSGFLYVNNLTDRRAFLDNVPDYLLNIPSLNRVATNQPLTVGISIDFKY